MAEVGLNRLDIIPVLERQDRERMLEVMPPAGGHPNFRHQLFEVIADRGRKNIVALRRGKYKSGLAFLLALSPLPAIPGP